MLSKKEIVIILVVTIILAFAVSLVASLKLFLYSLLSIFLILIINTTAKKITGYYLESEVEIKLWEVQRYWFNPSSAFKKPIPAGVFLPIVLSLVFLGDIKWLASLVFDVKAKVYRAAKRHGLYSFSEMTEYHLGLIAASGIAINLVSAVLGYFLGFPLFARLSIYYAFFNILPISELDGNKIFFGSLIMWSFLAAIVLIGMLFAIFII